jgi:hypothetical protein
MTPQESFILRLRRHRERNGITLDELSATTRVSHDLLDAFERNDLSAWPPGLYARAIVRGYATAVGVDASGTVNEFCRLFPQGDRRSASTMQEMASIVAHSSEYRDEFDQPYDRRRGFGRVLRAEPWHVSLGRRVQMLWSRIVLSWFRPRPTH